MKQLGITQELLYSLPDQRGIRSLAFEPFLELNNSVAHSELDKLLEALRQKWLSNFIRKPSVRRQRQFIDCLRIIMLNLMRANVEDSNMTVGIASGKGRLNSEKRYHPTFMSVSYFTAALLLLKTEGIMVVIVPGYQNGDLAQVARYALADKGSKRLPIEDIAKDEFSRGKPREVIHLRDDEKRLIDYRDTLKTNAMRDALARINAVLESTNIGVAGNARAETELDANTTLYRVFNNCSFHQGGRFYGGWWQSEKQQSRKHITINEQPTAEVDFTGLHASMLFSQAGLQIPKDPYALVPGVEGNTALRNHAKKTFNALLNAKSLRPEQPKDFDTAEHRMSSDDFRRLVISSFPMLPNIFGSQIGVKLQYQDSILAERIMLHFINQGLPILPVHDSFLVQAEYVSELVDTMKAVFRDTFGQVPFVTVKRPPPVSS